MQGPISSPRKHLFRTFTTGILAIALTTFACSPSPKQNNGVEPAALPGDIFTLEDEVMAISAVGPRDISFQAEISLAPLRAKFPGMNDEILAEYSPGSVTSLQFARKDANIVARLVGGKTYLIFARPMGRLYDIYCTLSRIDKLRTELDQGVPGVTGRACRLILCSPELLHGADLYALLPELLPYRSRLGIDDRQIGGWGLADSSGVCNRCGSFAAGGKVLPPVLLSENAPPAAAPLVVDMVPASLGGESNQDSEPFLAVDRSDPRRMVGTAFTPNPFGTTAATAPVYVSLDGGESWTLNTIVPSAGDVGTSDITVTGTMTALRLYSGIIRVPGNVLLNILRTSDFTSSATMTVQSSREQVDQPFAQATTASGVDRVYVGGNDFQAANGQTATVDLSVNGGTTFKTVRIESRNTAGQDGPSVRPAAARDGRVYAAYFGWRSFDGSIATSDVVVVRDDNGASGATPFQALKDPSDHRAGRIVVSGVKIPWSNAPTLGFERIGSTLSLAVDPVRSSRLYIAWADRIGNGDVYSLHVRRSTDSGESWSNDLRTVTNATCCALAVTDSGTVGFLYQQLAGSRWVTHLEQTGNDFDAYDDAVLASVPGDSPAQQFLPYMGDYNFLLAVDNEFRGVFSANNTPDLSNFPKGVTYQRSVDFAAKRLLDGSGNTVDVSIDPFYFSIPAIR